MQLAESWTRTNSARLLKYGTVHCIAYTLYSVSHYNGSFNVCDKVSSPPIRLDDTQDS